MILRNKSKEKAFIFMVVSHYGELSDVHKFATVGYVVFELRQITDRWASHQSMRNYITAQCAAQLLYVGTTTTTIATK